jgi:hypothetical protein
MIEMPQWLNTYSFYNNLAKGVFQRTCSVIIHVCKLLEQKSLDLEGDDVVGHTWVGLDLLG